ncbi:helix-turn-helix domain-containing protein [Streptomyces virginiae]|uniref:helix-turn-helix domain-containing protein n=1 Tax=Streptomyces virginiae TaxID=1961 RepID=UPI0035D95050
MTNHDLDDLEYVGTGLACPHCGVYMAAYRGPGRPPKYCSASCRQGSYRARGKKTYRVGADDNSAALLELALDMQDEVRHFVRLLSDAADPLDAVQAAARIEKQLDLLTQGAVGRARRRHFSWHVISKALGVGVDSARRRFHPQRAKRQMDLAMSQRTELLHVAGEVLTQVQPAEEPPQTAGPRPLAPAMSRLQRASGMPLRVIGASVPVSASYLSRVLCGVKFPSWELTQRFAQVCGEDPENLRPLWEEEDHYRRRRSASLKLHPLNNA